MSKKKTIGVEEISAYRTTDGKVFDKFKDAQFHQAELDIRARLLDTPLWGDAAGSRVDPEDLIDWIVDNHELVDNILKNRDKK